MLNHTTRFQNPVSRGGRSCLVAQCLAMLHREQWPQLPAIEETIGAVDLFQGCKRIERDF